MRAGTDAATTTARVGTTREVIVNQRDGAGDGFASICEVERHTTEKTSSHLVVIYDVGAGDPVTADRRGDG